MIANNVLRVAAINSVGDFILFLGKAAVVTATVLIGIELIKVYTFSVPYTHSYFHSYLYFD